jgi:hypothetical protein
VNDRAFSNERVRLEFAKSSAVVAAHVQSSHSAAVFGLRYLPEDVDTAVVRAAATLLSMAEDLSDSVFDCEFYSVWAHNCPMLVHGLQGGSGALFVTLVVHPGR